MENMPSQRMEKPICSICIANYNGTEVVEDCLNSVFSQDCDFPFEVIVHDDASTDGSAAVVRDRYPEVVLIASGENVGFCVANNRMATAARGKYILLLNNDATLLPDALRTLHAYAEAQSTAGILSLPQYDAATGNLIDIGSLCDPFLNPIPNLDAERRDVAMVSGACLWVPKDLWEKLGGFPEWFHTLAEDAYLCFRARVEGYSVQALGISGFRHWVGKSLGGGKVTAQNRLTTTRKRRALSERNKSFVIALTYPAPLFQLIFPVHIVLLLLEGLVLALIKREWGVFRDIYLACISALWQERKRLVRLRLEIQAGRTITWQTFVAPFTWRLRKLSLLLRHGVPRIS